MRELKFRAFTSSETMLYNIMPVNDRVAIDLTSPKFEQIWDEFDYMQFTGMKDKNGKDVYEGDVVHFGDTIIAVDFGLHCIDAFVVYGYNLDTFYDCDKNDEYKPNDKRLVGQLEIIGNIYENIELRKLCE